MNKPLLSREGAFFITVYPLSVNGFTGQIPWA
jgi:hypothetical protein